MQMLRAIFSLKACLNLAQQKRKREVYCSVWHKRQKALRLTSPSEQREREREAERRYLRIKRSICQIRVQSDFGMVISRGTPMLRAPIQLPLPLHYSWRVIFFYVNSLLLQQWLKFVLTKGLCVSLKRPGLAQCFHRGALLYLSALCLRDFVLILWWGFVRIRTVQLRF